MEFDLTAQGFSLANARICCAAAAEAYSTGISLPEETWVNDPLTDGRALVRDAGSYLLIAFRGSKTARNWLTDFDVLKTAIGAGMSVHKGFWRAMEGMKAELFNIISKSGRKLVVITGHSLGGALATDFAFELHASIPGVTIDSVYTFGSPRTGNPIYAANYDDMLGDVTFRVTHAADIVPWVPAWLDDYRHVGRHVHFDGLGMHTNYPLLAELAVNGLEIYRELRRGDAVMLTDHEITKYQNALAQN